jgi:hypothetical protein
MSLEQASLGPPKRLSGFLSDLGDGENGFSGTPVHNGEATLQEYLQSRRDQADELKRKPGFVPQTVF